MKTLYLFFKTEAVKLAANLDRRILKQTPESTVHRPGFNHIELAGEKVRLRPATAVDAKPAFKFIMGEPGFTEFMAWNGPTSVAELAETYGTRWPKEMQTGQSYPLAIEEMDKPGIIGCIHLRPAKYPGQFDFGYWLGKPYWNRGYMAEALGLLCYLCFKHLEGEVITGSAFTGNPGSRRVMEKNGFKLEGVLRRQILKNGNWVDLWHLSLLREEWMRKNIQPSYQSLILNKT